MTRDMSYGRTAEVVRTVTGVVIPVYLPPDVNVAHGEDLLADTVRSYVEQLGTPQRLCVSVDGQASATARVQSLCRATGVALCVQPENKGKLHGARGGVQNLLAAEPAVQYVAIVDQDGDHFANELPNLVRGALHIADAAATDRILVIGRRRSLHRPMGFLRGELEEWIDRVLVEAINYHAAVTGRPMHWEYSTMLEEVPDFQSGFKVFSRPVAEQVFVAPPQAMGVADVGFYRHAVETVMTVEALLAGAYLGTVNRSTFNEQPISTFGNLRRGQLFADKLIWPMKRLGIPGRFARQWMANHAPRIVLNTLAPQGREEIREIQRLVEAALPDSLAGVAAGGAEPLFL